MGLVTTALATTSFGATIWILLAVYIVLMMLYTLYSYMPFTYSLSARHRTGEPYLQAVSLMVVLTGMFVMLLTPVDAYRNGLLAVRWIGALLFAVLGYMLFGVRLMNLSAIRQYTSPICFIRDRFRSDRLLEMAFIAVNAGSIFLLIVVLLSIIGGLIWLLSSGVVSYVAGCAIGATVIAVLDLIATRLPRTLAGLDVAHAVTIMLSALLFAFITPATTNAISTTLAGVITTTDPSGAFTTNAIFFMMSCVCVPLYPHLSNQIVSMRSNRALRSSLLASMVMAIVGVPGLILLALGANYTYSRGLLGTDQNLGLAGTKTGTNQISTSPDVLAYILQVFTTTDQGSTFMISVVGVSIMAVLMSTVSHLLLAMQSVLITTMLRRHTRTSTSLITALHPLATFVALGVALGVLAIAPQSTIVSYDLQSFIGLFNALVIQLLPAIVVGLYDRRRAIQGSSLVVGMAVGVLVVLVCTWVEVSSMAKLLGATPIIALAANVVVTSCVGLLAGGRTIRSDPSRSESSLSADSVASAASDTEGLPNRLVGWHISYAAVNAARDDSSLSIGVDEITTGSLSNLSLSKISLSESFHEDARAKRKMRSSRMLPIEDSEDGDDDDPAIEPQHSVIVLAIAAALVVLSYPFYVVGDAGPVGGALPSWTITTMLMSVAAIILLAYVMLYSWDAGQIDRTFRGEPASRSSSATSLDDIISASSAADRRPAVSGRGAHRDRTDVYELSETQTYRDAPAGPNLYRLDDMSVTSFSFEENQRQQQRKDSMPLSSRPMPVNLQPPSSRSQQMAPTRPMPGNVNKAIPAKHRAAR